MKKLILVLTIIVLASCKKYENEASYRNYLRDQFPYSNLQKVDDIKWHYIIEDTINSETYFAVGNSRRSKEYIIRCINQ